MANRDPVLEQAIDWLYNQVKEILPYGIVTEQRGRQLIAEHMSMVRVIYPDLNFDEFLQAYQPYAEKIATMDQLLAQKLTHAKETDILGDVLKPRLRCRSKRGNQIEG